MQVVPARPPTLRRLRACVESSLFLSHRLFDDAADFWRFSFPLPETASAAVERRSTSFLESRCRTCGVALEACGLVNSNVASEAARSGLESWPRSERASPCLIPTHKARDHVRDFLHVRQSLLHLESFGDDFALLHRNVSSLVLARSFRRPGRRKVNDHLGRRR